MSRIEIYYPPFRGGDEITYEKKRTIIIFSYYEGRPNFDVNLI
jgi:hypothetical protein